MTFKAARVPLAAVLAAGLLISLLPTSYAGSETGPTQQSPGGNRPRRGKNGDPVTKSPDTSDSASQQGSAEDAKPEASKTTPPVPANDQPSDSPKDRPSQAAGRPRRTDAAPQSVDSQQQREAPPFDRPPLGANGRPTADSPERTTGGPGRGKQQPGYSDADSSARGADRGQTSNRPPASTTGGVNGDRFPESSGGEADPDRGETSGGRPPVLRRPADSRTRDDNSSSGSRPPVLRRPSDSPASDEGAAPDNNAGRPSASGQQKQGGDDDVVKLESTLVNIPLLVSDRSGRYIPQLSARDFLLYENGVQQTIASFGSEEVPFNVALVLDVSPSVAGSIQDIQDAAVAFVRQLRDQDRVMVVSFDHNIHYLSDFTSDRRQLEWAIRTTRTGSGTSVYEAVYEVVQRKLRNIDGRKALILFSDGEDTTSSHASYDDAINVVSESDVLVYGLRYPGTGNGAGGVRVDPRFPIPRFPIPLPFPFPWPMPRRRGGHFNLSGSTPDPSSAQSWPRRRGGGGDFMKDITEAGGGPVYDVDRISDMSRVAARIADELRHVYVISYYPTNALSNGGYRSIRVSVKGRDDIAVRHRRGYNAQQTGNAKHTI